MLEFWENPCKWVEFLLWKLDLFTVSISIEIRYTQCDTICAPKYKTV